MNSNLYAAFLERTSAQAAKPFIEWRGSSALDFADLPEAVGRYRAALLSLGLRRGDRVAVQLERSPKFVLLYLACLSAGLIFVPLNTAYTQEELAYFAGDAEPGLFVAHAGNREAVARAAAASGARVETIEVDGDGQLDRIAAACAPDLDVERMDPQDTAAILYTSGTTGRPKGAMLTHGNLSSNVAALHEAWRFSADDVIVHALPLFHAHGLFVALHLSLWSGATTLMLPRFDVEAVLAAFGRATVFMGVPTFYTRLLDHPALTPEACDTMRLFISGSAPLLATTWREFEARTTHRILERYGMTEALMVASNPYDAARREPGTVGFPLPGVSARVVDEAGRSLPDGEVGGLEIAGPNIFRGYWRRPEATRESFRSDGFFITGDLATRDSEGRVALVGRSKDLIISGGFNVYPAEVEAAIDAVSGVRESAVIGVPHADFGEAVVAAVVADEAVELTAEDVLAQLGSRLARFKQPKAVFVVEQLPRNAMGKVLKAQLRQAYETTFA